MVQGIWSVARNLHYPSLQKILIHIIMRKPMAEYAVILYYELNCVPSERSVEVLTSSTSEFDLNWK